MIRGRPDVAASMQIDIWSDIACPWCYIGKHRIEDALKLVPDVPVEVHCSTNLGSTDCPTDTVNPDAPGKTLRINATTNIGNVTVREP